MTRVFIPSDSAAVAVGADRVASAFTAAGAEVARTGSRGLYWLEPMVEVEREGRRLAFGSVRPVDAASILAGETEGLGPVDELPWFANQTRVTFARCGIIDPRRPYAFEALDRARELGPGATCDVVTQSQLRGRGGAGFPVGVKWRSVAATVADQRFVVCNADEGDSGTFADRMLMEGDPFSIIEGMAIAGFAVGASRGFIYARSEYPHANATMAAAIAAAPVDGFEIELRIGAGAYVCGEETALLESLEGRRGQVRAKPPLPAHRGLFGRPTVVNNVLSLATIPWILRHGADAYADLGCGRSRGTMPIQLAGNVKRPGLYEAPFGLTLGDIVMDIGGGTASGRPVRAVQCGGPLGAYFPAALFDTVYDYEAFAAREGLIGHGGVVVFDDTVDMAAQARFAFEFCLRESCGKCTPCRLGSKRGVETMDRVIAGEAVEANLSLVNDLCETLKLGSLCALGGFTPYPVLSALTHFPEDFAPRARMAAE